MATVLKAFTFPANGHRRSRYDKLLDGRIWRVVLAEDKFPLASFSHTLRQKAKQCGLQVRLHHEAQGIWVVQAYRESQEGAS